MIFTFRHIVPKNYVALTLWPLIIVKDKHLVHDSVLLNHERIHLKQQKELLILPFYLIYTVEWVLKLFYYRNGYLAYKNISFEREAYQNEINLQYLNYRKRWSFLKYYKIND